MDLTAIMAAIPERAAGILGLIKEEPIVYLPLIGLWAVFELFYIISNDANDVREVDVLDNSIGSIYVAIMISPIIKSGGQFNIADFLNPTPRTVLSIILFVYAAILMITAFLKLLPPLLVHILGGCSIDTFLTMMALIYVSGSVPIDLSTAAVIAVPMLFTFVIKMFRKFTT